MLTATCILLSSENKADFSKTSKLKDWGFYYGKNQEVYDISLPSLSVRERVEIERLLPKGGLEDVKKHLGYNVARANSENDLLLRNFIDYHARYPWLGKISL